MAAERLSFARSELFKTEESSRYPSRIEALAELRAVDTEIDVVVTGHAFPQLTNAAIDSFLRHERGASIHVVAVESSGRRDVFERLRTGPRISRVLLETDVQITGRHGPGSYGQSLSSAVGAAVSGAPRVFFSHSDMLAVADGFLSFLGSKLTGGVRLASFTQRGVVPFSAGMLVDRSLLDDPQLDWAPLDKNPFLEGTALGPVLDLVARTNVGVDSGEQFAYAELARGRPVHVCASRGGAKDWWQDPLGYYEASAEEIRAAIDASGVPIRYGELVLSRADFERRYAYVIGAGRAGRWVPRTTDWRRPEEPRWWRYSFDDDGRLIFIHLSRGTMGRQVRRWLRFARRARRTS